MPNKNNICLYILVIEQVSSERNRRYSNKITENNNDAPTSSIKHEIWKVLKKKSHFLQYTFFTYFSRNRIDEWNMWKQNRSSENYNTQVAKINIKTFIVKVTTTHHWPSFYFISYFEIELMKKNKNAHWKALTLFGIVWSKVRLKRPWPPNRQQNKLPFLYMLFSFSFVQTLWQHF